MPESSVVWVVTRCQARGLDNVWEYVDEFPSHRTGRVHRDGRPGLLVAVPCPEEGCAVCMEPGGAGDLTLVPEEGGGVRLLALSATGLQALSRLAESEVGPPGPAGEPAGLPKGVELNRRLEEDGRLISLPGHGDPPVIREVMSHQEFYVVEASIISNGLCTQCGLCEAVCPPRALSTDGEGRVRMTGDCFFGACGLCYIACPQLYWQQWAVRHPGEAPQASPALGEWRLPAATVDGALDSLRRLLEADGDGLRWVDLEGAMQPGVLAKEAIAVRRAVA